MSHFAIGQPQIMWLQNLGHTDRATAAASWGGSSPAGSRIKIRKAAHPTPRQHPLPTPPNPTDPKPRRTIWPDQAGATPVAFTCFCSPELKKQSQSLGNAALNNIYTSICLLSSTYFSLTGLL